jgi:TolB-like protein/cytochrome c-type biogenesis protein CcmH/NrfG
MDLMLFVAELRRRRVIRVLLGYGLAAFAVLQVVEPVVHALHLDDWILTAVVLALGLGFPVAVGLAWAFDIQPGGLERTLPLASHPEGRDPRLPILLLGLGAAAPGIAWALLRRGTLGELPRWVLVAGLPSLALVVALVVLVLRRRGPAPAGLPAGEPQPVTLPSVAVLPFDDLSQERDQDYFCDGIAEELLGALCGLSGLRVVSRSSSFQFKGKAIDVREVGRTLGATTLLEGSVRRVGSRVRVAARLVDAAQGFELWSERFDREVVDTFAVQEEIAQAVVRAMRLRLTTQEESRLRQVGASRSTRSPEAYDLYLRGRHQLMQHGDRRTHAARESFRQAVALDPGFAQAHAGLADTDFFILQWNLDLEHADELRAEALRASEEALRLEPELAEARLARANVLSLLGRNEEADRDFRRAMDLNPGWGDACYFYGRALFQAGRFDEAVAAYEEAARRNPDDFSSLALMESVHQKRGDLAAARTAGLRALAVIERRLRTEPDNDRALYMGAIEDVIHGDRARGFARIERAVALMGDDYATLYNAACLYGRLGQADRALELLDRAVGAGRGFRRWIENDADFDSVRADARFQAILARVKG